MSPCILLYCRPGFEGECAQEIEAHAQHVNYFGYSKAQKKQGFVAFHTYEAEHAYLLIEQLDFSQLVFARQWFAGLAFDSLPQADRVSPLLALIDELPQQSFHFLQVESPDTESGKALQGFCRKFTAPLASALKKREILQKSSKKHNLHLFFTDSSQGYIGYSPRRNSSPFFMGIDRLKFPAEAPSRSTLKLEEGLRWFLSKEEQSEWLRGGMKAVDLGAAPGGWTYQMVKRSIWVQAIDNGPMDTSLMNSGIVEHIQADGFVFKPKKPVDWLICDMIEKPARVAKLMAKWIAQEQARFALFNLKLPMKKRYDELQLCFDLMQQQLGDEPYRLQAKHLYHNREEVTVFLTRETLD